MPNIEPISDLKNDTAVVNEVLSDKQKALNYLLLKLQEAEHSVITEGTISADELEKAIFL